MDGVDLLPFVTGKNAVTPHKDLFWRSGNYRVVLAEGWKLQRMSQPPKEWLFNLEADPTEKHNLIDSEAAKRQELEALMDRIDGQQSKPLWPSVLSGAIPVDHPGGMPILPGDEYIIWDN
jgi:arylsulfatase A-like enzyme